MFIAMHILLWTYSLQMFFLFFFNTVSTHFPIPFSFECEFLLNVALPDTIFSRLRIFSTTWTYNRYFPFNSTNLWMRSAHNWSNEMSSESLTQTTPPPPRMLLCGDLPRPQSPSWLPQMIHLKCLAVRTPDSRHVNMNHATPHTAAAVLFAGLLLLAQSDAQLPVTCGGSGWWGQKHRQVFWSSARRSGPAVWRANFIEMDWVKVFFFFLSVFFFKSPV